jgi:hypothetical protein
VTALDKAGLVALADRCDQRASDLSAEADIIEVQADALQAMQASEYARWDADKTDAGNFRVRHYMGQRDDTQRRLNMTRDDVVHYQECAAALRAIAAGQP